MVSKHFKKRGKMAKITRFLAKNKIVLISCALIIGFFWLVRCFGKALVKDNEETLGV